MRSASRLLRRSGPAASASKDQRTVSDLFHVSTVWRGAEKQLLLCLNEVAALNEMNQSYHGQPSI